MKTITINSKKYGAHHVLVDDEDYDELIKYNWCLRVGPTVNYAITQIKVDGNIVVKSMHRMIMSALKKEMIDHINHNGLDNRKCNLRFCNSSQNMANKRPSGSSKYLGVYKHRTISKHKNKKGDLVKYYSTYKFLAKIKTKYKYIYLGRFELEEDAALAYNKAAIKYHGEFANLNIIGGNNG